MPPRLALLLLLVGRTSAQLGCATQEDLLANLRWVREACEEGGEAFADADTLVQGNRVNAGALAKRLVILRTCAISM